MDAHPLKIVEELKAMRDDGLISIADGRITLTDKGREEIKRLKVKHYETRCKSCDGRGIKEDPFGVLARYKEIAAQRPLPTAEYDQGYIREEDLMRRVAFIYERGDLEGANVMVIGDDDLISIAMALTGLPERITVLEIDDRLIDFINDVAKREGLNITAHKFDIRHDVPPQYVGKYNVFITDPVETIPGITLFLSRAASTLAENGAGYFGLTHIEASLSKWAEIERIILDMNFVITDMLRDFNVYPMANNLEISEDSYIIKRLIDEMVGPGKIDADFYRSTLIRMEALGRPKTKVSGDFELRDEVYVDDESVVTAKATR